MSTDPKNAVPTKVPKRKKYHTTTGKVDQSKLGLRDIVLAPEVSEVGRDTKFFEQRCEQLAIRALVETGAAEYILARPNHPHFIRVLEFVTERSKGKVPDIIKNEHIITPAVLLPAKLPEQIPTYDVVSLPPPGNGYVAVPND